MSIRRNACPGMLTTIIRDGTEAKTQTNAAKTPMNILEDSRRDGTLVNGSTKFKRCGFFQYEESHPTVGFLSSGKGSMARK